MDMIAKKPKKAVCRGCGAEIYWVRTVQGTRTQVDAEPVWVKLKLGGYPFFRLDGSIVNGTKAGDADDDPDSNFIEAHESHFATCPVGGTFRKPRKPRDREHRNPFW